MGGMIRNAEEGLRFCTGRHRIVAVGVIGACALAAVGCSVIKQTHQTIQNEHVYSRSNRQIEKQMWDWAHDAWMLHCEPNGALLSDEHFEEGFKSGFVRFLRTGNPNDPVAPPKEYLKAKYVSWEGRAAINRWIQGHEIGSLSAAQSGLRDLVKIPVLGVISPEDAPLPAGDNLIHSAVPVPEEALIEEAPLPLDVPTTIAPSPPPIDEPGPTIPEQAGFSDSGPADPGRHVQSVERLDYAQIAPPPPEEPPLDDVHVTDTAEVQVTETTEVRVIEAAEMQVTGAAVERVTATTEVQVTEAATKAAVQTQVSNEGNHPLQILTPLSDERIDEFALGNVPEHRPESDPSEEEFEWLGNLSPYGSGDEPPPEELGIQAQRRSDEEPGEWQFPIERSGVSQNSIGFPESTDANVIQTAAGEVPAEEMSQRADAADPPAPTEFDETILQLRAIGRPGSSARGPRGEMNATDELGWPQLDKVMQWPADE